MRHFITKHVCGVMCFLLTFTWSGFPRYLATARAATEPRAADLNHVADRLEKMFKALEEAEREIPRETFDLKAIVKKVGNDPQKLFEWVRDNTYLVPYRGALRGWQGVLMDRLGNSLDRSLLLGELLYEAGHKEVRLASAQLSTQQARELLDKARPIPKGSVPTAPRPSQQELEALIAKSAQQYDLDQAELRKHIHNATLRQQRLAKKAMQRTVEQAAEIAAAVKKFRVKEAPEARIAKLAATLQDHWWVQWKNGSQWRDLDPSLPKGSSLAQAKETFQGNTLHNRLFDEVHTLQIRLIIERWEDGRLEEVPVLTQQLWPFQLIGERIAIHHAPMNWPEDLDFFQEKEPLQALKTAVLAQREWVPVLSVGSARVSKFSFTDAGQVNDPTLPGFVQNVLAGRELVRGFKAGAEKLGQDVKDWFGGGGFGGIGIQRDAPSEAKRSAQETNEGLTVSKPSGQSQLTAEWIEYEMRVPGEEPRKIRRQIFDLVGPATRKEWAGKDNVPAPEITETKKLERGLALLGETEILPLVSHLSPQFIEHLVTKNVLANRNSLLDLLRKSDSATPKVISEQLSDIIPLPSQLYGLALARREWSRFREDVYLDRLNILSYRRRPWQNMRGQLLLIQGFDIVVNDMAVHSASNVDPFMVRLEQGVLDTNAEALLVTANCRKGDTSACRNVENTAELFAETSGQGVKWLTIQDTCNPAWKSVGLPNDVHTRIEQDLAAGYIVLTPTESEENQASGWWRINSTTGTTLGIGETGWGSSTFEYVLKVTLVVIGIGGIIICGGKLEGTPNPELHSPAAVILCFLSVVCFMGLLAAIAILAPLLAANPPGWLGILTAAEICGGLAHGGLLAEELPEVVGNESNTHKGDKKE